MATREEVKSIIGYMALAYSNFHPSLEGEINSVDVYHDLLGDMPSETLKAAAKACCAESGRAFAPSPGEIRGKATELHMRAAGVLTAGEAWAEVMQAIVDRGCHNGMPEFSSPIIREAVRAVGWVSIGMSENVMVERAHFLKIYEQLLERAATDTAMLPDTAKYIESQRQIGAPVVGANIGAGIKALAEKMTPRLGPERKGD